MAGIGELLMNPFARASFISRAVSGNDDDEGERRTTTERSSDRSEQTKEKKDPSIFDLLADIFDTYTPQGQILKLLS